MSSFGSISTFFSLFLLGYFFFGLYESVVVTLALIFRRSALSKSILSSNVFGSFSYSNGMVFLLACNKQRKLFIRIIIMGTIIILLLSL